MKKLILGLLIVGAFTACSSSEEKVDLPTQVQTLNETVKAQDQEYQQLKADTEELKMQVEELNSKVSETK